MSKFLRLICELFFLGVFLVVAWNVLEIIFLKLGFDVFCFVFWGC
ncbi:hypothetical protein C4K13_1487 [Pseudomonas chlororaphis subsp. aureofaciens]|nr:hypothetical protein C4K13_1487 [Pseudomonas chlororaphis subsp. aureofaciens]